MERGHGSRHHRDQAERAPVGQRWPGPTTPRRTSAGSRGSPGRPSTASAPSSTAPSRRRRWLECHVRNTIDNHAGHWHLNLNAELFDGEFLATAFVYEQRLVPPGEEYSPRPIHFCMEEHRLLPPGLAKIVKGMIEERWKRQDDASDPVFSDKLETKFHSVNSVYTAWAEDVQNKRDQASFFLGGGVKVNQLCTYYNEKFFVKNILCLFVCFSSGAVQVHLKVKKSI